MRAVGLVLVAIIGFVNSQQTGNARTYPDRARGFGSQMRKDFNNNPLGGPNFNQYGGQQHQPYANTMNSVHHQSVGNAPANQGQSSRGVYPDYAPVVNTGPASTNVQHVNAGAMPQNTGGNSGLQDIPLGPVQTGQTNQVNMVDAGTPPEQNGNSGEVAYDWGAVGGAVGGVAANGATGDMAPAAGAPLAGGETVLGQGTGGNSNVQYADNVIPLGGAQISDFTQKEAGKPAHSTGAASVGGATAGVVIAVLVLVGIVGVAAVFLIKQRRSRMTMAQV